MSVTIAPATLLEVAELGGAISRMQWGTVRELYAVGQFFAFRAGDELIALGGFNPLGGDTAEIFFNPAPAARRHMPGILAAGRLTILAAPYRGIVTVCRSEAGKVFARRLGFTFQAMSELGEVWRYGPSDRGGEQAAGRNSAAVDPAERGSDRSVAAD
jgi:hypothetical protein